MTIEEMKAKKIELGYTNEKLAEFTGVPLGTVQKIFAGVTKAPRYDTIQKLEKVLNLGMAYTFDEEPLQAAFETMPAYYASSSKKAEKEKTQKKPPMKPMKIKLGLFDGKYKMPSDDLLYGDGMSGLFEEE